MGDGPSGGSSRGGRSRYDRNRRLRLAVVLSVVGSAYATTVEDSVYVEETHRGQGIGKLLLAELVRLGHAGGFHAVMARIVDGNEASIRLHGGCGFELVGTEREVGRKSGRWLDVVVMQRLP